MCVCMRKRENELNIKTKSTVAYRLPILLQKILTLEFHALDGNVSASYNELFSPLFTLYITQDKLEITVISYIIIMSRYKYICI